MIKLRAAAASHGAYRRDVVFRALKEAGQILSGTFLSYSKCIVMITAPTPDAVPVTRASGHRPETCYVNREYSSATTR